jgi:hypothetical protein
MALVQSKQVKKFIDSYVGVTSFTASGTSTVVTTAITTALSTAGEGGVSMPLQVASSSQVGAIVTGNNRVEIYDSTTKEKLVSSGLEVYGRLTQSAGVYTLSYFVLDAGVETAVTIATDINFEFPYRFDFARVPSDFAISVKTKFVGEDPNGSGYTIIREVRSVTALNTLANLSKTPLYGVELIVNGVSELSVGISFSVSGKAITWNATNAGYALETTDAVIAVYETNE